MPVRRSCLPSQDAFDAVIIDMPGAMASQAARSSALSCSRYPGRVERCRVSAVTAVTFELHRSTSCESIVPATHQLAELDQQFLRFFCTVLATTTGRHMAGRARPSRLLLLLVTCALLSGLLPVSSSRAEDVGCTATTFGLVGRDKCAAAHLLDFRTGVELAVNRAPGTGRAMHAA